MCESSSELLAVEFATNLSPFQLFTGDGFFSPVMSTHDFNLKLYHDFLLQIPIYNLPEIKNIFLQGFCVNNMLYVKYAVLS